jgi:hypothetical protein
MVRYPVRPPGEHICPLRGSVRTIASVHAERPHQEPSPEENLLIEAISLLVQRQREAETWIADQVWQAEQRASATEQRYAELEARLASIEEQLNRLGRELWPGRSEPGAGDRLARLREQVEGLRSDPDVRSAPGRGATPILLSARAEAEAARTEPEPPTVHARRSEPPPSTVEAKRSDSAPASPGSSHPVVVAPSANRDLERTTAGAVPTSGARQNAGFLQLLGATPRDRFGFVLIAIGAIAIVYAVLSQLRFG